MVNRIYALAILLLSLFITTLTPAYASGKISVTVDRTQIHEDQTIVMTVTSDTKLQLSLSGLFSLSNMNLPKPDLGNLEDNFDILSRSQKYNIRTINSNTHAEINWVYTLAPKRTGVLIIPGITFKGGKSAPISIKVLPGQSPLSAKQNSRLFLVTSVDKKKTYVQEQIIYTVKLFFLDQLANGDISEPKPQNAIIEPAGKQKQFTTMKDHQLYNVIERKYLIYPQKSGKLVLPSLKFSGAIMGQGQFGFQQKAVRTYSNPITVKVRPPAPSFKGNTWLPAMSLSLSEKWSASPNKIKVGDSITRTLRIQALGLLGSAIPSLPPINSNLLKSYPNPPQIKSVQNMAGAEARWTQDTALIAVKAGKVVIPEISIPWWDTINHVERIAKIPARTIDIVNAQNSTTNINNSASRPQNTVLPSQNKNNQTPAKAIPTTVKAVSLVSSKAKSSPINKLYIIIAVLIVGWLLTLFFLLRSKKSTSEIKNQLQINRTKNQENLLIIKTIESELKERNSEVLHSILKWGQNKWPEDNLNSIHDLSKKIDNALFSKAIIKVEQSIYSATPSGKEVWDIETILSVIKEQQKQTNQHKKKKNELPSFYPE